MGPYYLTAIVALLGPVAGSPASPRCATRERTIEVGPRAGERFAVTTPTHTTAAMELDERRDRQPRRELRGRPAGTSATSRSTAPRASLALPDPNAFGGALRIRAEPRRLGGRSRTPRGGRGGARHRPARHGRGDRRGPRAPRLGPARPPRDRRRPQHPPRRRGGPDGRGRDARRPARAARGNGRRRRRLGSSGSSTTLAAYQITSREPGVRSRGLDPTGRRGRGTRSL